MFKSTGTHCKNCNEDLSLNPVYKSGYIQSRCKTCFNKRYCGRYKEYADEFRNKPENKLRKYERSLTNQYGISLEDYNSLLNLQSGACAICKETPERRLDVDHNHLTGEVRGLLCKRCNLIIGRLEENPNLISEMYDYLDRTTWSKGLELVRIREKKQA